MTIGERVRERSERVWSEAREAAVLNRAWCLREADRYAQAAREVQQGGEYMDVSDSERLEWGAAYCEAGAYWASRALEI